MEKRWRARRERWGNNQPEGRRPLIFASLSPSLLPVSALSPQQPSQAIRQAHHQRPCLQRCCKSQLARPAIGKNLDPIFPAAYAPQIREPGRGEKKTRDPAAGKMRGGDVDTGEREESCARTRISNEPTDNFPLLRVPVPVSPCHADGITFQPGMRSPSPPPGRGKKQDMGQTGSVIRG